MMIEQEHWTTIGQRVRLKDEAEGLYRAAYSFSPATVKKQKKDSLGYPMIFVEWDKTSWLYNGERDDWVIEAHFMPEQAKEAPMSEEKSGGFPPELAQALAAFLESQKPATDDAKPEPTHEPEAEVDKIERDFLSPAELKTIGVTDEAYTETIADASSTATEADAVLVLTVKSTDSDRGTEYEPHLYLAYKKPDAGLVLEMQLAKVVAGAMHDAGLMGLKLLKDKDAKE